MLTGTDPSTTTAPTDRTGFAAFQTRGADNTGFAAWERAAAATAKLKPMSNDEIALHKRVAAQMLANKAPLAAVKAYMDAAGVPKKQPVQFTPGLNPSFIGGALTSALHGATFGWDDEALGSLYGLVLAGDPQAGRDVYRAHLQQFHDQNPTTDLGLQIAGGVGGALLTGGLGLGAKAAAVAPRAAAYLAALSTPARVLLSGAAGGAAYGAGDTQGGVGDRLGAAAKGAIGGAVAGGLMTGGLAAAGAVLKPFGRVIPGIKNLYKTAEQVADDVVAQDLAREGKSVNDLLGQARVAAVRGEPITLPDLAGAVTLRRMAGVQSIMGQGAETIQSGLFDRQKQAGDRVVGWLQGRSKLGLQNVDGVLRGLLGARGIQSEALYDEAYKHVAPLTPKLQELTKNEAFRKAWNEARLSLRQTKGVDVPPLSRLEFPYGMGPAFKGQLVEQTVDGGKKLVPAAATQGMATRDIPTQYLPVAGLDWTKRYLDRVISAGYSRETGWDAGVASGLRETLKQVLDEVDATVPEYKLARSTYRGDSEVIDHLNLGRDFLKPSTTDEAVRTVMANAGSHAEREAYMLGAMREMRDAIYNKKAEAPDVMTVLGGTMMEKKLTALFGINSRDFMDRLAIEQRFVRTLRGGVLGSRTAPLAEAINEFEQQAAGVVGNLVAMRPGLALVTAARGVGLKVKQTHTEQVADALAQRYTMGLKDPAQLVGYLLDLQARTAPRSKVPALSAALGAQSQATPYSQP